MPVELQHGLGVVVRSVPFNSPQDRNYDLRVLVVVIGRGGERRIAPILLVGARKPVDQLFQVGVIGVEQRKMVWRRHAGRENGLALPAALRLRIVSGLVRVPVQKGDLGVITDLIVSAGTPWHAVALIIAHSRETDLLEILEQAGKKGAAGSRRVSIGAVVDRVCNLQSKIVGTRDFFQPIRDEAVVRRRPQLRQRPTRHQKLATTLRPAVSFRSVMYSDRAH